MKDLSFKVGNDRLDGTVFEPPAPKPTNPAILILHGWTSRRSRYEELAGMLAELGFVCLTYDMRGHGTSEGDIEKQSRQDFINDALAAYDRLVQMRNVDPNKISVIGSSFGSYIGAILSGQRKLAGLVLRVPANYPDGDMNATQFEESQSAEGHKWRYRNHNSLNTIALRALGSFNGKVLIVESEADEIVPHQMVQNFLDAVRDKSKLSYFVMEGAPHALHSSKFIDQYNSLVCKWFTRDN